MKSTKTSLLLLVVAPILFLFVVFAVLYFFSNAKVSTNFVYFEQNQYSSQTAILVENNKLVIGESEGYKNQKRILEECKLTNPELIKDKGCEAKFGFGLGMIDSKNSKPPKIYLYNSEKESSKLIDFETAKNLNIIPERKNEKGESFETPNCGGGGFIFGYYGPCNTYNKVVVKKNEANKTIDLETNVMLDQGGYGVIVDQPQRNIFWIKE